MGCTVRELHERIDAAELNEWLAYHAIEPWGEARAEARNGILAALIANIHRRRGARAFRPEDFMQGVERKAPGPGALRAKIKGLLGGRG